MISNKSNTNFLTFDPGSDCTLRHTKSLAAALAGLVDFGDAIEIDCSCVEQADITFVQTLIAAQRSCAASGVPFALSGMSDVVASAFQRAGVTPPGSMPSELSGI